MLKPPEILPILKSIPWFFEMKPDQLDRLAAIAYLRYLDTGEALCLEGDREDNLYVILEGEMDVTFHVPTRGITHVMSAEPLDIIGWSTLTPVVRQRIASAYAKQQTSLLGFNGENLRKLCEEDHDFGYIIMRRISNVVASWLLNTRLHLLDIIVQNAETHSKNQVPVQGH